MYYDKPAVRSSCFMYFAFSRVFVQNDWENQQFHSHFRTQVLFSGYSVLLALARAISPLYSESTRFANLRCLPRKSRDPQPLGHQAPQFTS